LPNLEPGYKLLQITGRQRRQLFCRLLCTGIVIYRFSRSV
jgi:hypothetical protein